MKNRKKRWNVSFLAVVLAAVLAILPLSVSAAGGSYTKEGTFHIDQFGEYDIVADVTVTDGKISNLDITGENFTAQDEWKKEVNKGKLQSAASGMTDSFLGLEDTDAEGIKEIDAVSGATYSSRGIKQAVAAALELDITEQGPSDVPAEIPEAGIYDITVAVRSEVVDHSLVETDTTQAVLKVDENGRMNITYTMVSGTEKEPMYILGVNGYYLNNDKTQELSTDGMEYETEKRGDYEVVTKVTYPLSGLNHTYYTNTTIYVPAMSNLDGQIAGIWFENGKFSVATDLVMYWETLKKQSETQEDNRSMEITASVQEEVSGPSFGVTIPASVSMGTLSSDADNIMPYDIYISSEEKSGEITVEAPEKGKLYSNENELPFTNTFGIQKFNGEEGKALHGEIQIYARDTAKAPGGNYTGTAVFTISCKAAEEEPGNPEPDPEEPGDTLKEGKYTVDVSLYHEVNPEYSMGNKAMEQQGLLVVDENGDMDLQLTFHSLEIMTGMEGYLANLKKIDMSTVQKNPNGYLDRDKYTAADADILETYPGGEKYPKVLSIPVDPEEEETAEINGSHMNYCYVEIYVPLMESLGEGQGTQVARLFVDWESAEEYTGESGGDTPGGDEEPGEENPPGGDDGQDDGALDVNNLEDGVYSVTGRMVKVDRTTLSMADNAINHTVKLTVKDGKYALALDLKGLSISGRMGYLGRLKYFKTGYTTDKYGNPAGDLADVTVESYQLDEDGTKTADEFGTDYPDMVTFEMIQEARKDGYVPLQVYVPVMESIAAGTGTQPAYLSLNWDTLKAVTDDDDIFKDDGNDNGNDNNNGGGSGLSGGSVLTGGSNLSGGSSLTGGSNLSGGSGLTGSSSLTGSSGLSSSQGNSSLKASNAKTGDQSPVTELLTLAAASLGIAVTVYGYNKRSARQKTEK